MDKIKKNQHYVPLMYLKNFRSQITDDSINSKEGLLTCYRPKEKRLFYNNGKDICFEKFLYEYTDDEMFVNDIENKFCKNIEGPFSEILKNIICKCYAANIGDICLSEYDISMLNKYISIQIFRHPILMMMMLCFLLNQTNKFSSIPFGCNDEDINIIKRILLDAVTNINSKLINDMDKLFKTYFYINIVKSNNFNYFTSDVPVVMDFLSESKLDDFYSIDSLNSLKLKWDDPEIYMPLNKDFCVLLSPISYYKNCINGKLLIVNSNDIFKELLYNALSVSDIIIADHIANDEVILIDEIYANVLAHKEKMNEIREIIINELKTG